jgi:hypothetical protein
MALLAIPRMPGSQSGLRRHLADPPLGFTVWESGQALRRLTR